MFLKTRNTGISTELARGKGLICETRSVRTHRQANLCTPSPFEITPRVSTFPHMKRCWGATYGDTLYQVCNEAVGSLLSAQQDNVVSWWQRTEDD
jgi:hypothetical protein